MIQAKSLSGHCLLAAVAVGCGKVETGIPWWAIFAAVIVFASLLSVFSVHTSKENTPATKGDLLSALAAHNLELKSVRETIDSLDMEPLGTDGTQWAPLPDGTNAVKLPDGTFRLATPVRPGGIGVSVIMGNPSAELSAAPPEDGDQS